MPLRAFFRGKAGMGLALTVLMSLGRLHADTRALPGGGTIEGRLISAPTESKYGATTITLETSTGARVTLEQNAVGRSKFPIQSSRKPSGARVPPMKHPLTPTQRAWLPRVRSIVARFVSTDPSSRRRARAEALTIDDPDAIPALMRFLQSHPSEDARRLYVTIVQHMPDRRSEQAWVPKPTDLLVMQSLYDPSPTVSELSRRAIGPGRADAARRLYILAIRSGRLDLSGRA